MKKNLIFKITILSILMIFIISSCKKEPLSDPIPNPVVPPVVHTSKYTVEIIQNLGGVISPVGKMSIDSGSTQNFVLTPDDGFKADSVFVNGVVVPVTSNGYTITNVNTNYTVKPVFKMTEFGSLIQEPWKNVKRKARIVGMADWWPSYTPPTETFVYNKSYRMEEYDSQGKLIGDVPYTFTPDSLILGQPNGQHLSGGIRCKIIVLSKDTLTLRYTSKYYDENNMRDPSKDEEIQDTYTH